MTSNYLSPPKLKSRNFIVNKEGRFSFTDIGIRNLKDRLHNIGVDITSIDTLDRYIQAYKVLQAIEMKQFSESLEPLSCSIEKKWLLSVLNNNHIEKQRLQSLLIRKSNHRLRIIK